MWTVKKNISYYSLKLNATFLLDHPATIPKWLSSLEPEQDIVTKIWNAGNDHFSNLTNV